MKIKFELDDGTEWDIENIEQVSELGIVINREHLGYSDMEPYEPEIYPSQGRLLESVASAWTSYRIIEKLESLLEND